MLVDRACSARLGELVRGLLPGEPGLEVFTDARDVLGAEPGAACILVPDARQADWLNLERPSFGQRALRLVLFSDEATTIALAQRAPDFFHWISHRIECPAGAPRFAVAGLRAALAARAPSIAWTGGDLESAFAEAFPGRILRSASAHGPFAALVDAARPAARSWLAWRDVDDRHWERRSGWAAFAAGRRGRVILADPAIDVPDAWPVRGTELPVAEARARLADAGAKRPGVLAALVDLEPEAVNLAALLLRAGQLEADLLRTAADAADAGAALALRADATGLAEAARYRARLVRVAVGRPPADEAAGESRWAARTAAALGAGDAEAAEYLARRWLERGDDREAAELNLGTALTMMDRLEEAEAVLRAVLASARDLTTTVSEDAAVRAAVRSAMAMHGLGTVYLGRGDFDAAARATEEALAEWETVPGHGTAARTLRGDIAIVRLAQGRTDEGVALLVRAIEADEAVGATHDVEHAKLLSLLGEAKRRRGEHAPALDLARRAVRLSRQAGGEASPAHLQCVEGLARVLVDAGNFDEATRHLERALAIVERTRGAPTARDASLVVALGTALAHQARYDEAAAVIEKGLAMPGLDPKRRASLLEVAGGISFARGRYAEAESQARAALAAQDASPEAPGPDRVTTLGNLALALRALGRAEEAVPVTREAVELARRTLGERHPVYAVALSQCAEVEQAAGKRYAPRTAKAALEALAAGVGPNHPTAQEWVPMLRAIVDGTWADGSPAASSQPVAKPPRAGRGSA